MSGDCTLGRNAQLVGALGHAERDEARTHQQHRDRDHERR